MPEDSEQTRAFIRAAAAERARLHAAGARRPDASPALIAAYAANREFIDRADSDAALDRLRSGDPEAMEYAVCFLEVYPFCPDSGFAARDIAKALRPARQPDPIAARLRAALLAIVAQPQRDEFRHLRALALKVADSEFVADLDTIMESPDIVAAENARVLVNYIVKSRLADQEEEEA